MTSWSTRGRPSSSSVEEPPPPTGRAESSPVLRELADLFRALGAVPPRDGVAQEGAPGAQQAKALRYFQQRNPPKFTGSGKVSEAEDWLLEIRKQLEVVGTPEEYWVLFASYQLKGEADRWWNAEKGRRDVRALTWVQFEELFCSTYISTAYKRGRVKEFTLLQQGSDTVHQYAARFTALSHYAPHLVADEEMRAERFQDGLKPFIRSRLVVCSLRTYSEVVDKALLVEADAEQSSRERDTRRDGSRSGVAQFSDNRSGGPSRDKRRDFRATPYQRQNGPASTQQSGGQRSTARAGSGDQRTCFYCKEPGHYKPECPKWIAARERASQPPGQWQSSQGYRGPSQSAQNQSVGQQQQQRQQVAQQPQSYQRPAQPQQGQGRVFALSQPGVVTEGGDSNAVI